MQKDKIDFYVVRGVGGVISASADFVNQNFKALIRSLLFIAGPFAILSSIMLAIMQSRLVSVDPVAGEGIGPLNNFYSSVGEYYSYSLLFGLLGFFFLNAVTYEFITFYNQEGGATPTPREIWSKIRKDWWLIVKTIIGLILVSIVIMFALSLVSMLIGALGASLGMLAAQGSPILAGIVSILVVLAMVSAVLAMFAPLALIFNVRINERLGFFTSLSRCYELCSGQKLKTIGVIAVCMVIQVALTFVFMLPGVLGIVANLNATELPDFRIISIIAYSFLTLANYLLGAIYIVAISFQYYNLLERKESVGLKLKVESFGTEEAETVKEKSENEGY